MCDHPLEASRGHLLVIEVDFERGLDPVSFLSQRQGQRGASKEGFGPLERSNHGQLSMQFLREEPLPGSKAFERLFERHFLKFRPGVTLLGALGVLLGAYALGLAIEIRCGA